MHAPADPTVPEYIAAEDFTLAVPRTEMEDRRDSILRRMSEEGIDVAVFTTPQSLVYLTGNQAGGPTAQNRPTGLVLGVSGDHRYVVRLIDAGWERVWGRQNWVTNWRSFRDEEPSVEVLADAVRAVSRRPVRRLGLELNRSSISYESVNQLFALSGASELVSCAHLVEDLRVVKSDAEIAIIRRAGVTSCRASDAIVAELRKGRTDVEAAAAAWNVVTQAGGLHAEIQPHVFSGPIGEVGHVPWARVAPKPGELTSWFVSGVVHHYACPIERSVIKKPDESGVARMIDSVINAVERLTEDIRPGMTSEEAYAIAYECHRENGFAGYFPNHAAYSFGIHWPEFDLFRLRPNDERVIQAGMTFHVTPLLVVPRVGCVLASRALVVTDEGGEPLNEYPLRIEELE